jgi:hypothetical protein
MRHRTALPLLIAAALLTVGACRGGDDASDTQPAADSIAPGMVTGTTGAPGPGTVGTPGTPGAPKPDTFGRDSLASDTTAGR